MRRERHQKERPREGSCTCAHPGLHAGPVESDAGVEQGDRLGHEAVADGAEELGRGWSHATERHASPPLLVLLVVRWRNVLLQPAGCTSLVSPQREHDVAFSVPR